jgi:FKBP-type peptidyl-prolyl cis-trans isomerase FkpA
MQNSRPSKNLFLLFTLFIVSFGMNIEPMTASELRSQVLLQGKGRSAQVGNQVTVHYTGKLADGTVFDSSLDRKQPFVFTLGQGEVIKGWDQGINGMKIGEKRLLTIPPELGYGAAGAGSVIPPNATLVFEVELLSVSSPPKLIEAGLVPLTFRSPNSFMQPFVQRPRGFCPPAMNGVGAGYKIR